MDSGSIAKAPQGYIFSAFILNFSDYEAIYGALAAIPVLMIWININWVIVLFGAEFTVCLSELREEKHRISQQITCSRKN